MPGAAGTQTRVFTYDKRGLLTQEQHPEIGTNGDGTARYSLYDARGHAGKKTISTTIDLRYEYDAAERLIRVSDAKVGSRDLELFSWDCIRLDVTQPCTTVTHPAQLAASARFNYDSDLGTIAVTQANQYDPTTARLVRRDSTVGNGEISGVTHFTGESFFFTQSQNDLGLPDTMTYPCRSVSGICLASDPGRAVQHGYTKGQLKSVGTWASNISYRSNGMIDTVTHGAGSSATLEKWEADPNGMARPRRIYSTNASGTQELWSSGTYEYDGAGNVKSIGNTSYFYDPFGRLSDSRGAVRASSIPTDAKPYRCETALRLPGGTVITAASLSTVPQPLVTRAQNDVAERILRETNVGNVAPATGFAVSPFAPSYH